MNERDIFVEALQKQDEADRQAFLRAVHRENPALGERVEGLLKAHADAESFLESLAAPPTRTIESSRLAEGPGTVIGPYRLMEQLGEGGMGVVWLAEQTHPVRRQVALKVIKPGLDSRRVIARFEVERQTLASMDHPNIAKVHDAGTTACGRPYFVMELVVGVSITDYCEDHGLTLTERLRLFLCVCHAVQHAHQKGIIHRDLKASNVLVGLWDGEPVPKVIDFGIAKAAGPKLEERTTLTGFGQILGTLESMSPEQASFKALDVDTRSDIYSLGALLYELLAGSPPFDRRRLREAGFEEVLRIIKEEEPPRPSARLIAGGSLPEPAARRRREPARMTRLVRGDLDWIVMKCLEKDRSRRYESADGLARDIGRYLTDEPVEASPPSAAYRLKKLLRRHRGPALSAAIILLMLAGGVVGTTVGLIRAEEAQRSEAHRAEGERLAKEMAEKRLVQIEKGIGILGSIFEDLDPQAEEKEGRSLRAILGDRLERAINELDGEAVGDPLVMAGLQDRLGRTSLGLGRAAMARSLFLKAVAIRRARLGGDHPATLAAEMRLARTLREVGELDEAIALGERVHEDQARTLGADHRDTIGTLHELAFAYWKAGRPGEALVRLERVRDALARQSVSDDPQTLATLESLSGLYAVVGKSREAIVLGEQMSDALAKRHGIDHPDAIMAKNNLANNYRTIGKMRKALVLYEEARDAIVPKLGIDHPKTLLILSNLAETYRAFGRTEEAVALGEQVRQARVSRLGAYHPDTIHTLYQLGLAYMDAGKPEAALPLLEQATAGLVRHKYSLEHAGRIIASLCKCLHVLHRHVEAGARRQEWLAAAKAKDGLDSAAYAEELEDQAGVLLDADRHADAEPILRECLAVRLKVQPESWEVFHVRSLLGGALAERREYAEAEPLLIDGYEGLKARERQIQPLYARYHLSQAGGRIVRLYEASGRPEDAAAWRAKLGGAEKAHP